jgi:hypothetical protein
LRHSGFQPEARWHEDSMTPVTRWLNQYIEKTITDNYCADTIRRGFGFDAVGHYLDDPLSATGYGSVASPVISTLSLFSGGVANFIEFANGYCGNEPPFYVGVQYFVMPIHGC